MGGGHFHININDTFIQRIAAVLFLKQTVVFNYTAWDTDLEWELFLCQCSKVFATVRVPCAKPWQGPYPIPPRAIVKRKEE